MPSSLNGVTYSLRRIVRYDEVAHFHSGHFIPLPIIKNTSAASDRRSCKCMPGEGVMDGLGCVNRLAETLAERAEMTYMVQMVMGDKYSRECIHIHVILLEHHLQTPEADSGIDKDSAVFGPQVIAVAAASARQTHELKHQRPPPYSELLRSKPPDLFPVHNTLQEVRPQWTRPHSSASHQ